MRLLRWILATCLAVTAAHSESMMFGPDIDNGANGHLSYGGGGGTLTGVIDPLLLAAGGFATPWLWCPDCHFEFTTGPLEAANPTTSTWSFGGGVITLTGGVDTSFFGARGAPAVPNIPHATLFTGTFDAVSVSRCDVFDPGELCMSGNFDGTMDARLASIYGLPTDVSGAFNDLTYLVQFDPHPVDVSCLEFMACGPFPPEPFVAPTFGPGGGNVVFSASTPEPGSLALLASALLLAAAGWLPR